jgi:polyisoprenoid-binding protein YceI
VTVRCALAIVVLACCPAAGADIRQADGAAGTLEFQATQAGAKFTGAFRRFHVRLDFDPAQPAAGSLDVTVETGSVDTQDSERDEVLKGPDFFWTEKYPQAAFHATSFERTGAGWRATGELTIRGVKKAVPVNFSLALAGAVSEMQGTASLKRLQFGIGQGDWASTEWIGDDVDIRFGLKLAPAG